MQGIFINGRRPASKKAVREALATDPGSVRIEATSFHGNEYDGPADGDGAPDKVVFVGPDPERKRNFYGTATRSPSGSWTVK
jgi:hypothetical protein